MIGAVWTKIRLFVLSGLAILAAILYGLLKSEKARRAKDKLDRAKLAVKVQRQATVAMVRGINRESKEVENARIKVGKSARRDHFES